MGTRSRHALFGTVTAALAVGLCLAVLEVALRVHDRFQARRAERLLPPVQERAMVPSSDPELLYALQPGFSEGSFRVNDLGLADDPVSIEKPDGTFRVVVAGDSVACNFRLLPRPQGFADVLESLLRERGEPAEVLNLGVNGYSLRQSSRAAELGTARFAPDLVVVQISLNDPYPAEELVPGGAPHLASRLVEFVRLRLDPRSFWAWWFVDRHYDPAGIENLRAAFERLATIRAGGVPVLAVLFPYLDVYGYEHLRFERHHALYAELAREHGIAFLDLREPFAAAGQITDRWPQDPQHPGADGHDLAARVLADRIDRIRTAVAGEALAP